MIGGGFLLELRSSLTMYRDAGEAAQPPPYPAPGHTHIVDAERGPHLRCLQIDKTIGGFRYKVQSNDPSFEFLDSFARRTSTVPTPESGQTLFFKAVSPHSHRIDTAALRRQNNPRTRRTRSQAQDNPRTASVLSAHTATTTHASEVDRFRGTRNDSIGHASEASHDHIIAQRYTALGVRRHERLMDACSAGSKRPTEPHKIEGCRLCDENTTYGEGGNRASLASTITSTTASSACSMRRERFCERGRMDHLYPEQFGLLVQRWPGCRVVF